MSEETTQNVLPLNLRKRYSKAKRLFEMGIWFSDLNYLKVITLTTKLGLKNDWKHMVNDNREMRRRMKESGYPYEDCMCGEFSPDKKLIHLHGLWRMTELISNKELHSVVSANWLVSHGAFVVWVEEPLNSESVMNYSVKHAVKNYLVPEISGMRILKSKGWCPVGWKEKEKYLIRWALEHQYYSQGVDGERNYENYVPLVWDVYREYFKAWCEGKSVHLDYVNGDVALIEKDKIYFSKSKI